MLDIKQLPSYYNEGRGYIGWNPFDDSMAAKGTWTECLSYPSWDEFRQNWFDCNDDLNLVFDFYFDASCDSMECEHCESEGCNIKLKLWIGHPRKGASRGILIKEIKESNIYEIKQFLKRSWQKHKEHFAWILE